VRRLVGLSVRGVQKVGAGSQKKKETQTIKATRDMMLRHCPECGRPWRGEEEVYGPEDGYPGCTEQTDL